MPATLLQPGVYIEEIPSGVRTITGVATSITAFVGRAPRGPVDSDEKSPVRIFSFADYERVFGGLSADSSMSFAVLQYFLNGGSDALIVRVHVTSQTAKTSDGQFEAANPGAAGNRLRLRVDYDEIEPSDTTLFNLKVKDLDTGKTETFPNVVITAGDPNFVSDKLLQSSELLRGAATFAQRPAANDPATATDPFADPTATALTGGVDGAEIARTADGKFEAANPGAWANRVRLRVDYDIDDEIKAANTPDTMFNLRVKDVGTSVTETFLNVSITAGHPRFVSEVLLQSSNLLRGAPTFTERPDDNDPPSPPVTDPFDDSVATPLTGGADGSAVGAAEIASGPGLRSAKKGLFALEKADLYNLLCIPPFAPDTDVDKTTWDLAIAYAKERRAMVLVDPPFNTDGWDEVSDVTPSAITGVATRSENAALFFPRIKFANPLRENRPEPFAPCGAVAGVIARTDASRGVFKSAAGIDATLSGALDLSVNLTDSENGVLNPLGVNCLRTFATTGPIVWGSRTLKGADSLASEWKYLAVRRTALFLEESLYRGTQFAVFEPNDEPLYAQIRLNVGAFLQSLFLQGAFQGKTPREAYFVKCDRETTTQTDVNLGVVNILVGFAPLKPAEFVVIKIQQIAGAITT